MPAEARIDLLASVAITTAASCTPAVSSSARATSISCIESWYSPGLISALTVMTSLHNSRIQHGQVNLLGAERWSLQPNAHGIVDRVRDCRQRGHHRVLANASCTPRS